MAKTASKVRITAASLLEALKRLRVGRAKLESITKALAGIDLSNVNAVEAALDAQVREDECNDIPPRTRETVVHLCRIGVDHLPGLDEEEAARDRQITNIIDNFAALAQRCEDRFGLIEAQLEKARGGSDGGTVDTNFLSAIEERLASMETHHANLVTALEQIRKRQDELQETLDSLFEDEHVEPVQPTKK